MKFAEKHEMSQYFCVEYYLQVKLVNWDGKPRLIIENLFSILILFLLSKQKQVYLGLENTLSPFSFTPKNKPQDMCAKDLCLFIVIIPDHSIYYFPTILTLFSHYIILNYNWDLNIFHTKIMFELLDGKVIVLTNWIK